MNLRKMVALLGGLGAAISLSAVASADPTLFAPPQTSAKVDATSTAPAGLAARMAAQPASSALPSNHRNASLPGNGALGQLSPEARNILGVAKVQALHAKMKGGHGGAKPADSMGGSASSPSSSGTVRGPGASLLSPEAREIAGVAKVLALHAKMKGGHGGAKPADSMGGSASASGGASGGSASNPAAQRMSVSARNIAGVAQVQALHAKMKGGHGGAKPADSVGGSASRGAGGGASRGFPSHSDIRTPMTHATLSSGSRSSHCHGNGVCL